MFPYYKHKFGVGCIVCKHIWFLLTNDDEISEELEVRWAKSVLYEHDKIHEEEGYGEEF